MGFSSEQTPAANSPLTPSSLDGKQAMLIGLAIFLLNMGLKMLFLDSQAIANDEPFTLFWAQKPLSDIWALAKNENNPPLHFIIQHFWLKWFGWSVASIRFPSLVFSSLGAMLLFRSGNRHFGLFAGVLAALMFTLSTEHILYSHEARTYSLLSLLSIAAIDRYLRLAKSPNDWKNYAFLGLFNVLLIYSHFLGIWVLLSQVLLWPLMPNRKATFKGLLLMFVGVGLAYAPNLYAFYLRLQSVAGAATWVPKPHWRQIYGHINIFLNGPVGTICLAIPVLFGLSWMLIGKKNRTENLNALKVHKTLLITGAMFVLIYGGIYFQSLVFTPAFIPRYLIFVSMPFFLAIAGLIDFMIEGVKIRIGILVLIIGGLLAGFQLDPGNFRDLKGLTAYIQSEKIGDTPLIICPEYLDKAYVFHADLALFQNYERFTEACIEKHIYGIGGISKFPKEVLENSTKIIYLDADAKAVYPTNGILEGLRAKFPKEHHEHFEEIFDVYVLSK